MGIITHLHFCRVNGRARMQSQMRNLLNLLINCMKMILLSSSMDSYPLQCKICNLRMQLMKIKRCRACLSLYSHQWGSCLRHLDSLQVILQFHHHFQMPLLLVLECLHLLPLRCFRINSRCFPHLWEVCRHLR